MQVLQSANLPYARRAKPIERAHPVMRGQIVGVALLALIYGIVLYASIGLFRTSPTETHATACRLIGFLNVVILPLLVVAAVIGIRRIWLGGAPKQRLSRLLTAPLWISLMLSLLTIPIGMGQANATPHGSDAGLGIAPTFLLAPWGFMLAYGLSLLVVCAMHDFTFPVQTNADSQPNAASLG